MKWGDKSMYDMAGVILHIFIIELQSALQINTSSFAELQDFKGLVLL